MKLTAFTDYSLRVLIYLAAEPERRATIAEISAAFDIKENHLTKVVHHLGKRGWVETVRGKGGGLMLARPARDIGIGRVVRDTEGAADLGDGGAAVRVRGQVDEHAQAVVGECGELHEVSNRSEGEGAGPPRSLQRSAAAGMAPAGAALLDVRRSRWIA